MKRLAYFLLFTGCGALLSAQAPPVSGAGMGDLTKARVFKADEGGIRTMANGGQSRDIVHGTLQTGEVVGIHESTQPAGTKPNPLHTIQHSELILVREGTLAFVHDGLRKKRPVPATSSTCITERTTPSATSATGRQSTS